MAAPLPLRPSIPTQYNGIRFRSKLEADWARWFDRHKVIWQYEPVGICCGPHFVCPDFWLPQAKQWFEVKAVLTENDVRKFSALTYELTRECPETELAPFMIFGWPQEVFSLAWYVPRGRLDFCREDAALVKCLECGLRYFVSRAGSWTCRRCGRNGGGISWIDSSA